MSSIGTSADAAALPVQQSGYELILTHDIADFDGLAAAVAAQHVYPDATIALGRTQPIVAEYLGLHRDRYRMAALAEVDQDAVTRVVIVDMARAKRLAHLPRLRARILAHDPTLEVIVWDHHPASIDDLPARKSICEPVGSATTLLVEQLARKHTEIGAPEATLFALGIHVDTGSLTFGSSTDRDARALAWLMQRGVHLGTLNRYLQHPLRDAQRTAIAAIFERLRVSVVRGARIGIAVLGESVSRLGEVATHAIRLEDVHALLLLASAEDGAIHVVARSKVGFVDVGMIVTAIGGGGHASAAAATLRDTTCEIVVAQLEAALPGAIVAREVGQVMSSPVHSVTTRTPMTEVRDALASWGVSGLAVTKKGKLVGVLSLRDLKRAAKRMQLFRDAGHFMSAPPITTTETTSLDEAVVLMEKRNIGRLPVMRQDRIVGILTRRDAVRMLYEPAKRKPADEGP